MAWLTANAGTIFVLLILIAIVGSIIGKMISDRRKGISACSDCPSSGACAIHASGNSCSDPQAKVEDMEPRLKKVR